MPDGKSTLGCGGESFVGMTKTAATCVCEPAKADTWTCVATDSEMVMNECPAQDDPKTTGESCAGVLGPDMTQQRCMWSQRTAMDVASESFWCTCDSTGESANVWVCDGAFAPVSASKGNNDGMMAADTPQEIITTPVVPPTGSTGTVTKSAACPDAPVENASSCAGFLPGALPKATCTYSQFTQENNDAPVTTLMDCTCATTDLLWSCAEPVVVPTKANEETKVGDVDVGTDVSNLATDEATAAAATVTDAAATVTDAAATATDAAATVTDAAAGTIAGATDALNDSEVSDIADVDVTGCDGLNGVLPQDGEDCKQYMPDGKSTLGCGGESYSGTTKTAATCICDPSKAVTP